MNTPDPVFVGGFENLTDEEVEQKIQNLTRIVFSQNVGLARQARPMLMALFEEQSIRNSKKFQEHLDKSGVNVDDIINIG